MYTLHSDCVHGATEAAPLSRHTFDFLYIMITNTAVYQLKIKDFKYRVCIKPVIVITAFLIVRYKYPNLD